MALIRIAHLYPDIMNMHADKGNLTCLKTRFYWLGFDCVIEGLNLKEKWDLNKYDMVFMGGGSDRELAMVREDMLLHLDHLSEEIDNGLPALFICGAYKLLGSHYESKTGEQIKGLDLFAFHTSCSAKRFIGDIAIKVAVGLESHIVVGFENHSGCTHFDADLQPWGKVIKGYGNNNMDMQEGILFNNLIGTNLHGPLLPKNPAIADLFINSILHRKGIITIHKLDDQIENLAHTQVARDVLKLKRAY